MRFIADITILAFKWWLNEIRCRFLSQRVKGVLHNAPMKKQPQSEKPNLYLVGFMGVGKSAIGRKVAKELGFQFIDSDHEIERKVGKKIPQIFESEGEARFRQYEREFIESGHPATDCVISTGGGLVVQPGMKDLLKEKGVVVCLFASVESIVERTSRNSNRPLLQVESGKADPRFAGRARTDLYGCGSVYLDRRSHNPGGGSPYDAHV